MEASWSWMVLRVAHAPSRASVWIWELPVARSCAEAVAGTAINATEVAAAVRIAAAARLIDALYRIREFFAIR